jgi:hypothetical protein
MVKSGSSYLSQSELPLTFGLGKPEDGKIAAVEVLWPSGKKEVIRDLQPNQAVTLQEGRGVLRQRSIDFTPEQHRLSQ